MAAKRQQPRGGKPNPLVDRYTYITSVKAGNRTIAWLAIDRKSKRVVVAAPVGKARLLSLKNVRGLAPGHLAPILRLLKTPESSQLPADLGSTRPVGIAIADYVPGDTLHARLKVGKLPPLDAVNLCAQVVRAVRAMHEAGTAHGAISPRSVVISPKGKWSAPVVTQLIAPTSGGFSSRERLQKRGPSFEDDSWAAHATLHAALTGEGPFAGKTREELLQNMFGGRPRRLDEFGVDEPELQKIIDRGLVTNPRFRASIAKLEQSLQHWLEEKGKAIASLPPASGNEPMFPRDDAPDIMLSEPPLQSDNSAAVPLPRPHGKSLVGIVIDEPIDADAPAFAPPQRPEDLLDAVDDEDEEHGEDEEAATRIYDPSAGHQLPGSEPPPAGSASEGQAPETAPIERAPASVAPPASAPPASTPPEPTPEPPAKEASTSAVASPTASRKPGVRAKPKGLAGAGSGQALAAALALAVAAVVTLFVRYRTDQAQSAVSSATSAAPSAGTPSAEQEQAACVAAYFPDQSLDPSDDFAFLCSAIDLRSTVKQLEKRVVSGKSGSESDAAKAWAKLGWFELPLAAVMRQSCCEHANTERIVLPQPPPNCQSLSTVLKEMTRAPISNETMSERSRDFERVVECLTAEKQGSAYGYDDGISPQNREAFSGFIKRSAGTHRN